MMNVISCCKIYIAVISVTCIASSEGVKIESVGLTTGLPYAEKGKSAHFAFNATLEPNEEIQSVIWTKDNETGSYEWTKEGVKGSGVFSVAQNTSDNSGNFIFDPVELSQSGNYTVKVTTNKGTDTGVYQFFVHYTSGSGFLYSFSFMDECFVQLMATNDNYSPYPNISCVFEEGLDPSAHVPLESIANVTEEITALKDGTFNYGMEAIVTMEKIPVESFITCNDWIQNSRIQTSKFKSSEISGQPCPEPPNKKDYVHKKVSGSESCYGGYAPFAKFSYSCIDGPKTEKLLTCKQGMWTETDEIPWPVCKDAS